MTDKTQIYDFNPGFGPKVSTVDSGNGFGTRVFWTAVIPDSDVQVNPAAGTAEMTVSNLPLINYFSKHGSAGILSLGPKWQTAGVDANVSFDVVWNAPITRRVNIKDAADGFAGTFNEVNNNNVTVSWSGSNALGFSFTSNVGNLTTSTALAPGNFFAQLAQERNGIFFPAGGAPGGNSPRANGGRNSAVSIHALPPPAQANASAPRWETFRGQLPQTTVFLTAVPALEHRPSGSIQTGILAYHAVPAHTLDQLFADWDGRLGLDAFGDGTPLSWAD